jgi:hypothetical protein
MTHSLGKEALCISCLDHPWRLSLLSQLSSFAITLLPPANGTQRHFPNRFNRPLSVKEWEDMITEVRFSLAS